MKAIRTFPFFIFLILCTNAFADKLEKAFERMKLYDYFLAKDYFEKCLDNKTAGAAYGLSVIYGSGNNPFFNLDSARHYILLADSTFQSLKEKEKLYYKNLGITGSSIHAQEDTVCRKAFDAATV